MTSNAPAWKPIAMNASERWAAASDRVGWITADALQLRDLLDAEVARLQARRDALDQEIADARDEGRREGIAQGLRQLADATERARRTYDDARAALEGQAVDAALVVAEVIVRETLSQSNEAVAELVARLLDQRPDPAVRVKVSEDALASVRRTLQERGIEAVADPALSTGDVVVEYPDGQVDARLATVLAAFRPDLEQELHHG